MTSSTNTVAAGRPRAAQNVNPLPREVCVVGLADSTIAKQPTNADDDDDEEAHTCFSCFVFVSRLSERASERGVVIRFVRSLLRQSFTSLTFRFP